MKKLFAALLSLCLMLTACAALADEPTTVNWSDFEAKAANVEGQFATVGDTGLKMFIPAQFKDTPITEETLKTGTFMVLRTEDGKAVVTAQLVPKDVESFKAAMQQQGHSIWETIVNNIHFAQFSVEANGTTSAGFALPTESGKTVVFGFAPANQEPYTDLFKMMVASLQVAK